jgi:hypothetical protein
MVKPKKTVADERVLLRQWHPTKNGDLRPNDVGHRSDRPIWWKCEKGDDHEWRVAPGCRSRRGCPTTGCPFCAGKRIGRDNSLAAVAPQVAATWHPTMNGRLTPRQVTSRTPRRVWWRCAVDPSHEWRGPIRDRAVRGNGCPFCSNHRASKTNSLAARAPRLAAEWHPTKNGTLTPKQITARSGRSAWWQCPNDPTHAWQAPPSARMGCRYGCPFCSNHRVSRGNSLATRRPHLAAEWHPTNNGELTPRDVVWGSCRRVWWRCLVDSRHQWQATPDHRSRRGDGCPFCIGKRVSPTNSLKARFPRLAAEWHPTKNGDLTPSQVTAGSGKRVWWRCQSGHEWTTRVAYRSSGQWPCPTCRLARLAANRRFVRKKKPRRAVPLLV